MHTHARTHEAVKGRGRPRVEGLTERRKADILAAATSEFAEKGYSDTDLQVVADKLGCAKGTIYRYFESKEDLFSAALSRGMMELGERIATKSAGEADPPEKIGRAIRAFLTFFDEHPDCVELLMQERAVFKDKANPTHEVLYKRHVEQWRAWVNRMPGKGGLRNVPVERMAGVAADMLFGAVFSNHIKAGPRNLASRAEDILDVLMHGIMKKEKGGAKRAKRGKMKSALTAALFAVSAALSPWVPAVAAESAVPAPAAEESLEDVLVRLLKDNQAFKILAWEVMKADSSYLAGREMYSPMLSVSGNYTDQKMPVSGINALFGTDQYQYDLAASISKQFMTGTSVSLAMSETLYDTNDPAFGDPALGFYSPAQPPLHTPVLSLSIRQELLKNSFGYSQRKLDRMLKTQGAMQRRQLISQASDMALKLLMDYWQVGVEESALSFAEAELAESRRLLDIAKENVGYGKAEVHDLTQYRAMVAGSEIKVAAARQAAEEARRAFRRQTGMEPATRFPGVTDLVDGLPALNRDEAVSTAYAKRADFLNAMDGYETAKLGFNREKSEALPSVAVVAGLTSLANAQVFETALDDVSRFEYPSWNVGFRISYPLFNPGRHARLRDAFLLREQTETNLARMREEVRDDVLNKMERVELAHFALSKSREVKMESEAYYEALLKKSRIGQVNSYQLKQALDSLTSARQQAHVALVGYNLSVLSYKRAREELFEHYGVTLEGLIRKVLK